MPIQPASARRGGRRHGWPGSPAVGGAATCSGGSSGRGQILLEMTADQIKAVPDYRRPSSPAAPPVTVAVPPPK
ncbi:MAG: hypothetical protein NVS2B11_04120 [Acetobacteraceae bacterium]